MQAGNRPLESGIENAPLSVALALFARAPVGLWVVCTRLSADDDWAVERSARSGGAQLKCLMKPRWAVRDGCSGMASSASEAA